MKTIIIDRRKFAEADDGDTCYYGGEITLTVIETTSLWWKIRYWLKHKLWVKDTRKDFTYCCRGSDRSGLEAWRSDGDLKYHLHDEFFFELGSADQIYEDVNIRIK